ncbi:MAG: triose-phosphate isomerase [Anaerolineae bacterium]
MYRALEVTPPFFEIGPKAYLYGYQALALAKHADAMSVKYGVQIFFTPQAVDIRLLAAAMQNVQVFAQHMDALEIGRGIGAVLPEALQAAGATGTLLNHAERKLSLETLERTIRRADNVGLGTMVCADHLAEAVAVARLHPNVIIAEAPELIGVGKRATSDRELIGKINQAIWDVDPAIRVLHAAGISTAQDVYDVIAAGAQGSGSTSGIMKAPDRFRMLEDMIRSVRAAWDDTH